MDDQGYLTMDLNACIVRKGQIIPWTSESSCDSTIWDWIRGPPKRATSECWIVDLGQSIEEFDECDNSGLLLRIALAAPDKWHIVETWSKDLDTFEVLNTIEEFKKNLFVGLNVDEERSWTIRIQVP